jgi:hypothetical protein
MKSRASLGGDTFDNESVRRSLPIRFAGTTAATPHYCPENGIGPEKISRELQVILAPYKYRVPRTRRD